MHHWQTPICAILSLYLLIKIYISLPTYCLHQRRCWFMLDCAILTGWDDLFKSMLEGIIIFSWKAIRWSFIWNSVEAMLTIYSSLASASAAATPLRSDIWDKMSFSESSGTKNVDFCFCYFCNQKMPSQKWTFTCRRSFPEKIAGQVTMVRSKQLNIFGGLYSLWYGFV